MATKSKNKTYLKSIINSGKTVNDFILDTTEMIVDETIQRTSAWQNVTDKALKGALKLTENQSDITFKALETLKKQWIKGQNNYKSRVNN